MKMNENEDCRHLMVEEQIVGRGISDPKVIQAMEKVPRHLFVDEKFFSEAYADYPLPIGEGQTISQPYMVALMTQCLELQGGEKVLEIGTGSGYQAAVLAEIAQEVYTVERFASLAERAKKILTELNYFNIKIKISDGTLGWEEASPFQGIIVTAGAPDLPLSLVKQLSDGGRLVVPIGGRFMQTLSVFRKKGEELEKTDICGCVFVPLVGGEGWRG